MIQPPEGANPEPSSLISGPAPAAPSPQAPPGAPAAAEAAAKPGSTLGISQSQSAALGSVAAGASTVFLLGTLATLLFNLFPLRLANSQWQLTQMGNLVANGSWLLLGLVLLHLAALLQPNQARLTRRLATLRRLAAGAAVLYLLLAPLQLAATWNGIDTVENTRSRVVGGTMARVKVLREAIQKARDLPDLRRRAAAIPGAPPIPEEAATLPFETLRRTLLGQLDTLETNVKRQLGQARPRNAQQEIWRQTLRGAFTSLLLAIGFASGAEGRAGKPSLLASLLALRRPSLPRRIQMPKPTAPQAWQRGWQQFVRRWSSPSSPQRRKPKPNPKPKRKRKRSGSSQFSRSFTSRLVKNWQTWGLRFWDWRF